MNLIYFIVSIFLFIVSFALVVMSYVTGESRYITSSSACMRPFYVVVSEKLIANGRYCLDLLEGDIFLVTSYNKIGYWWGVSVYDLQRQGWFPSSFVQPYTGEVPQEASDLLNQLIRNSSDNEKPVPVQTVDATTSSKPIEYNIVANDDHKYTEYESTGVISRRGKKTFIGETAVDDELVDNEDFDYDTWAKSKEASTVGKRSRR